MMKLDDSAPKAVTLTYPQDADVRLTLRAPRYSDRAAYLACYSGVQRIEACVSLVESIEGVEAEQGPLVWSTETWRRIVEGSYSLAMWISSVCAEAMHVGVMGERSVEESSAV